jgi:hypothetical protein
LPVQFLEKLRTGQQRGDVVALHLDLDRAGAGGDGVEARVVGAEPLGQLLPLLVHQRGRQLPDAQRERHDGGGDEEWEQQSVHG